MQLFFECGQAIDGAKMGDGGAGGDSEMGTGL